jgi:DNA-binding CsgD family transcriptional regulator
LSNNEIAQRLALSPHTVKTHLNTVFRKFNVTKRSKLMTLATHV